MQAPRHIEETFLISKIQRPRKSYTLEKSKSIFNNMPKPTSVSVGNRIQSSFVEWKTANN
ncbi:hypothetical protein LEP1GSC188_3061 [Leptospira weilii serovar Topaz str. LT2116]|uniref:Uncharacterized protein n=1 Tax=Leptospira weilii serovar Topaz str. LT2116 TaxID=1088540 RepID=M3GAJ7_9LEPT|nr:hypothetical protein LEP1GSC188_3061 [Leptospira weilii serovar Topaz str. LT2116]